MAETLEERNIIQPQHLTDVHVVWENSQFVRQVFEEEVVFSET